MKGEVSDRKNQEKNLLRDLYTMVYGESYRRKRRKQTLARFVLIAKAYSIEFCAISNDVTQLRELISKYKIMVVMAIRPLEFIT